MDELKSVSNRERNKNFINQNSACQSIIKNLKEIEEFWDDFSFLSVGRPFMICRKHWLLLYEVNRHKLLSNKKYGYKEPKMNDFFKLLCQNNISFYSNE